MYAPVGYIASTIDENTSIDFNIGSKLNIKITDITNIGYTYKLTLQVQKPDSKYQDIATKETNAKSFTWDLSSYANTLYSLLSTRTEATIKIKLETYFNNNLIGYKIKEGKCYVVNSNPDKINFSILALNADTEISSIAVGYGPYNDNSNCRVKINQIANTNGKNKATLKEVRLQTGKNLTVISASQLVGQDKILELIDPFNSDVKEYIGSKVKATLTVVDSRGNKAISEKTITISNRLELPTVSTIEFKRDNGIDTKTKMIIKGKLGNYGSYGSIKVAYWWDEVGDTRHYFTLNEEHINTTTNTFKYEDYIYGNLGANGFSQNKAYYVRVSVYTSVTQGDLYTNVEYEVVPTADVFIYISKQHKGIAIGGAYDEEKGGKLQVYGEIVKIE